MAILKTALTSFWYEPEFQGDEKVKFKLRPLTQRDMIEIDEFMDSNGGVTRRSQYEAGMRAITAASGFVDEEGNEVKWPTCAPFVDRNLIIACGFRSIIAQTGGDWDAIVAKIRKALAGEDVPESSDGEEGLEKN